MPVPSSNQGPVRVFVSFSSEDDDHLQQLEKHLSALKREGAIEVWTHHALLPGEAWEPTLLGALHDAELVVLLVSADFMASDYIHEKELAATLERHRQGDVWVVPVLIRPVDVKGTWFDELQGLPPGRKPVSQWRNRDEAWTAVATGVRALLPRLLERRAGKVSTGREGGRGGKHTFRLVVLLLLLLIGLGAVTAWKYATGGPLSLEAWAFTSEGTAEAPLFRPLEDGTTVKPGPLHFGLLVNQPAYIALYYLNLEGDVIQMFPRPGKPYLLVQGGARYVIPREECCLLDDRPGDGYFLIVAGKSPTDVTLGLDDVRGGGLYWYDQKAAASIEGPSVNDPLWTGSSIGVLAAGTHFRAWPGEAAVLGEGARRMFSFHRIVGVVTP